MDLMLIWSQINLSPSTLNLRYFLGLEDDGKEPDMTSSTAGSSPTDGKGSSTRESQINQKLLEAIEKIVSKELEKSGEFQDRVTKMLETSGEFQWEACE